MSILVIPIILIVKIVRWYRNRNAAKTLPDINLTEFQVEDDPNRDEISAANTMFEAKSGRLKRLNLEKREKDKILSFDSRVWKTVRANRTRIEADNN